MKKTVMTLAAVWMMMGGVIACAQQPEKKAVTDTATEQPAPAAEPAAEPAKPTTEGCAETCQPKGDEKKPSPAAAAPEAGTAADAK